MGLNLFKRMDSFGKMLQTAGQMLSKPPQPAARHYDVVITLSVRAANKKAITASIKALKSKVETMGTGLAAKLLGIGPDVELVGFDVHVQKHNDGKGGTDHADIPVAEEVEDATEEPGSDEA